MGQETSSLVSEDTRPDTLSDRSVSAVADLIRSGRAKRIVVMTGAGISTAAGIPDFRSPKTGLYHNLARLNLPHPEAVFEIDFFRNNPRPFYVLAKELYPGNFHPTVSHAFMALLAKRKLLRMLFTQNIDCLERAAGVPSELIVEAHGSFATQRCIDCKTPFPDTEMRKCVESASAPVCVRDGCGGLVKPDIVFFGEQLPSTFFENATVPQEADLVIVVGTSLQVHPFAGLPRLARDRVPRLLFNMERVGDFGTRADDVVCLGPCDDGIRKLADELGWRDELEKTWVDLVGEQEAERQRSRKAQEEIFDGLDEIDELVQALELSEDHDDHDSEAIANAEPQEKK
ncbi:SIR2 family histone deacetylase, partial [Xylaria flabelliformis]